MDSEKHIEQLLEKYWNATTSLEEEKELSDFFTNDALSGEAAAKWKDVIGLFNYYKQQRSELLAGKDFDAVVIKKIQPKGKSVRMFTYASRIAAGLVVVALAAYLVRDEIRKSYPKEEADTYSDPKLALEETKKAFLLISKSFGKAQQEAKSINLLNEAEAKVGEKKRVKKEESSI